MIPLSERATSALWALARSSVLPAAPAVPHTPPEPTDEEIAVTYVGHATALVQLGQVNVLTDPVYAERLLLPKRLVAPGVPFEALPRLDIVLVSHGHMDHLDLPTHQRLPNDAVVICASNLSDLLIPCGYQEVVELTWGQSVVVKDVRVTALPVRHWGTRALLPDNRGYTGFVLESAAGTVFFPGDTAYFEGFRDYGRRHSIDVALLPIGAYRPAAFRRVHMSPEDAIQAFVDLNARYLIPIHWGTFLISAEPIDEPPRWLRGLAADRGLQEQVVILQHGQSWLGQRAG
jgi:L-ascorbate metabolism protein UlaG (beta-lactamase superfamily)